jgi:hypothetical protein
MDKIKFYNMKELAVSYFKGHQMVKSFFFTSDEQAFFNENDAKNHSQSLPKEAREITEFKREDCVDEVAATAAADIEKQATEAADAIAKENAIAAKEAADTMEENTTVKGKK